MPKISRRDCQCYKHYIAAVAGVNKLILENFEANATQSWNLQANELRTSTLEETEKALIAATKHCFHPLCDYTSWGTKVLTVVRNITRDKMLKLKMETCPYDHGALLIAAAFTRFHGNEHVRNVRESLLASIRTTLHEGLTKIDIVPEDKKKWVKEIYKMAGEISEGRWIITLDQARHRKIVKYRPDGKEIVGSEKGFHKFIDIQKEQFYELLRSASCFC